MAIQTVASSEENYCHVSRADLGLRLVEMSASSYLLQVEDTGGAV